MSPLRAFARSGPGVGVMLAVSSMPGEMNATGGCRGICGLEDEDLLLLWKRRVVSKKRPVRYVKDLGEVPFRLREA